MKGKENCFLNFASKFVPTQATSWEYILINKNFRTNPLIWHYKLETPRLKNYTWYAQNLPFSIYKNLRGSETKCRRNFKSTSQQNNLIKFRKIHACPQSQVI